MAACWRAGIPLAGGRGIVAHMQLGAALSVAVLVAVLLLARGDGLRAATIGHHAAAANARAFLFGAGLWLAPALAGLALCIAAGWTTVTLEVSPAGLLGTIPIVALGVLLVEAFPEELALRGYIQGVLGQRCAAWVAMCLQALLFLGFAWAVGALSSAQQWMFLPGFALVLGYARAVGGSIWVSIGIHTAWMTTTQLLLSPLYGMATVQGVQTLQFVAFVLLPSATICTVLASLHPRFSWRTIAAP
jgi:membrane protease YdiL (CAAX protease family)